MLDAATEENASEAVQTYARKYKAYEGLLRQKERLRERLVKIKAGEENQTGSETPSGTPATTRRTPEPPKALENSPRRFPYLLTPLPAFGII